MKATAVSIAHDVYPEIPDDKYGKYFLSMMIIFHTDMMLDTDDGLKLRRQLRIHRNTLLGSAQVFNHLLRHLGRVIWDALRIIRPSIGE